MKKLKKIAIIFILVIFLSELNLPFLMNLPILSLQSISQASTQPIANGIYEIEWVLNSNKVIDISAAETRTGANVQIWDKCNGKQQRFELTYLNNGYYIIKNINSGKVLDVASAGKQSGTNVWQWESNSTDAQKWKIEKNTDDTYCIISKCNGLYLFVTGSKDINGANIEVNSKKHSFNFKKITTIKGSKTINDGYYIIATALDENKVIDISTASKLSGANVQIWQNVDVPQQKFYVKYDGYGYYTIKNVNSNKMIDVANGQTERGNNVWQWTSNSTDAQKWVISKTSDGYYNIISKSSGINLEVAGGKTANGTNIQINFATNSKNQKFRFIEAGMGKKTIENGTYEITSKIASNMLIDVSAGSSEDGANVQIWADANEKQQKFELTYLGNGSYKILCKRSGKALTASETGTTNYSNVYQSTYIEKLNQMWRIEKKNNEYYIISEYNGKYLDVAGGSSENGTNVRVYTPNFTNAQTFIFEQKKYGIDVSHWQNNIDFDSLKKSQSIDFMIIRAGQSTTIKDSKFERNYTEAKKYGIPLGVYLYATAQNIDEARAEANHLVDLLKGKSFELPVYYDVEAQENVDINTITAMCNEFCRILKLAGYKTGIYASKYYYMYKILPSKLPSDCSIWVASYGKDDGCIPKDSYKYNGKWDIWQFTSTGKIAGISGNVDYDVGYRIP